MRWAGWCFLVVMARPAAAQLVLASPLTERFDVLPGQSFEAVVKVVNTSADPVGYSALVMDYTASCDSGYSYAPAGTTEHSLAAWMDLERAQWVLDAHEGAQFKVRISVPEDFLGHAAHACIMVQTQEEADAEEGLKVGVKMRYAINFIYRNPLRDTAVDLRPLACEVIGDELALEYMNLGVSERLFTSMAKVVSDDGQTVYQGRSVATSIQPNQCRRVRFKELALDTGAYLVVVLAETDAGERFGLTHQVEVQ